MEDHDQNPPKERNEPSNKLYFITYNVRSLSTHERLIELSEALKDIKWDIVGISEMRRLGNKIEEYDNFILCHTGYTPGKYGVGFLIKKRHKKNLESYFGFTERVALLNVNIEDTLIYYSSLRPYRKSK